MPWYYAGAHAKPVGPVTLEELHAARRTGAIRAETYVIEHTGAPSPDWTWKRYQELFPAVPPPPAVPPVSAAHSSSPSAAPVAGQPHPPRHLDPYYAAKPTNHWCIWGFFLGLAGFIFSFACGIGLLLAIPALLVSAVGLAQLRQHPGQGGRGLAAWGLALSVLGLVVSIIFAIAVTVPMIKAHETTVTEQTSNDSQ